MLPGRIFAAGVWLGILSSSAALATCATSRPLFPGTAGEVPQNEGGTGSASSLSPGPTRGSCRRRGRLCHRCCRSRSAALPPQKNQGVSQRMSQGNHARPQNRDLLLLKEAFPGCASICAAPSCAPSQYPISVLGMLARMPSPGSNMVVGRQLQAQPRTPQNINRLPTDGAFRYVQEVWIHLPSLTGNEGVKWDFCTSRVLPCFSEMLLA